MARPKFTNSATVRKRYRERDVVIRAMGFPSYKAYLSSSEWKGIRREKLAQEPGCAACGCEAGEIHHRSYSRRVLEGRDMAMLASLCSQHHRWIEIDAWGRKRSPRQAADALNRLIASRRD